LAAAVELIHVATLVHDDVLDEAAIRRHLATVNARWDNETSVLLGDYLLARSICLAASVGDDPSGEGTLTGPKPGGNGQPGPAFACRTIGDAARVMCEGELRQAESRGNFQISEPEYLDIIAGKTAALIACCCRLGAFYAGADPTTIDRLADYGHNLGIAFQIADDVLDVTGDEAIAGKSLGTDLNKQKPTLPLIHLMQRATADERIVLGELLSAEGNHRRGALQPWFERYAAVDYARRRAAEFAEAARRAIDPLDPSPATEALGALTRFVVNRDA
jgi:octaprenyl-diphosphate synthase